jgi:3D (Asp-Asp-Asp) domain-containing protein
MKSLLSVVLLITAVITLGATKQKWKCETKEMTVTAYCPCSLCTPGLGKTATGRDAKKDGVAVDPEVIPLGKAYLDIPGADTGPNDNGSWLLADDTGGAVKKNIVDLRLPTHKQAKDWGRKKLKVRIWTREDR